MDVTCTVRAEPWESGDGVRLRAAQRVELDAAGTAVGCGGLRPLGAGTAEIKRMYVAPRARGTGVAVAVLQALEDEALLCGVTTLVLETGVAQPDAIRFYEREGYRRIDNFGPYRGQPLSVCYARDLLPGG